MKKVEEKLKLIDKKIANSTNNMTLVEENLVFNENEIKKQITKTNHEKNEIDIINIKAKADYDLTKKEMEEIINKTRLKYIESQDKIINAQKALSKISLTLKKLNKLYENLNNPRKLSPINRKESRREKKETFRMKKQYSKKFDELDINKINTNLNNNENKQKEKNILTFSTSPTINDINKKQIEKIKQTNK